MTRSVLVVDDAPAVAASAAQALGAAGHLPRVATSVDAALAELIDRPDAVVLDYALDRPSALLRHALVRHRVPTLLVSGLDDDDARAVAATHGWPFLPKPFDDAQLAAAVAALVTHGDPMPDRDSPDPRPSLPPSMPPAPAAVAPRVEEPLPAPPPAPAVATTPSGRPLSVPVVVQAIDRIGDVVGVIVIGHLCALGKLGGIEAAIVIGAILGVGTGLRQAGARVGAAPGLSVLGLLVLGLGRWLAPAAGAAELARVSGVFGLVAVLALGCGPARDALLSSAGAPPPSGCAAGAYRCNGSVPEACSRSGRWWPSLPRDATGRQLACLDGCVVGDGGVAHCVPADGGAR